MLDCAALASEDHMPTNFGPRINDAILALVALEHQVDPYFRDAFNKVLQRPLVELTQLLLRLLHRNDETGLCQEIPIAGEGEITQKIKEHMARFTECEYHGRIAERAGNTKTYGVVRAEFVVRENVPPRLKGGIFEQPNRFPAWIRFGGPGPLSPPDVKDAGIISIG